MLAWSGQHTAFARFQQFLAERIRCCGSLANFGADFVKLDSCAAAPLANGTESWAAQYTRWAAELNSTGRKMVFSCSWAVYYTICLARSGKSKCGQVPWEDDFISNICHMWRYGEDLAPAWDNHGARYGSGGSGVKNVLEYASSVFSRDYRSVTGEGAFNDPDFLVVGCPTDAPCDGLTKRNKPLTDVEQRTQMSMWCILAAPLIIGSDIRNLTKTALATLSNAQGELLRTAMWCVTN